MAGRPGGLVVVATLLTISGCSGSPASSPAARHIAATAGPASTVSPVGPSRGTAATTSASAAAPAPSSGGGGRTLSAVTEDDPSLYADGAAGDPAHRFASPSGNIWCTLASSDDHDWVTCLVREKTWPAPACGRRAVTSVALQTYDDRRPVVSCAPEGPDAYRRLAYGHAITEIAITCTSRPEAMTCRRGDHGRGFSVSRDRFVSY